MVPIISHVLDLERATDGAYSWVELKAKTLPIAVALKRESLAVGLRQINPSCAGTCFEKAACLEDD